MKTIFFGSSSFSEQFLESINGSDHEIIKVFTGPDKRKGRGKKIKSNLVKDYALKNSLDICVLDEFDDKNISLIKNLVFDCAVVVSFGTLIPSELLEQNKTYINIHPSKLPKYRGPAPIKSTLMHDEKITAVSIIELSKEMDAGDILAQTVFAVGGDDNKESLEKKHIIFGRALLLSVLDILEKGEAKSIPQIESEATYTRLLKKSDFEIDWSEKGREIFNKIRAFGKKPGAFTFLDGKRILILDATLIEKENNDDIIYSTPGTVARIGKNDGILVTTGDESFLKIVSLKPQGKKEMSYKDFINGYKIKEGIVFSKEN